ncbi:DUF4145 domain-containing protein [Candidatus Poriferisocius sp.]|uniref:DUF4145 domain-containing protein n=1 Tax=Candidatus Poriferisocius sp. TaxID=3101276 RepID=UPI003B016CD7
MVTDHSWFAGVTGGFEHPSDGKWVESPMQGSQGHLFVSKCLSQSCQALALWIASYEEGPPIEGPPQFHDGQQVSSWVPSRKKVALLVFPHKGIRVPPEHGLEPEEVKLYEEAAAVALISPRAACALVRVLLEALLKRFLVAPEHSIRPPKGGNKSLVELIDMAVADLPLSATLRDGLTAIRKRGNTALHDLDGLNDETRAEELPWLFQAVDDLVDDLHTKPQRWAGMAKP